MENMTKKGVSFIFRAFEGRSHYPLTLQVLRNSLIEKNLAQAIFFIFTHKVRISGIRPLRISFDSDSLS